jgi:NIPSNAP protein
VRKRERFPLTPGLPRSSQGGETVLVDHRYYRVRPGTMNAHLDLYEKHGFAAQTRHLGQPLAYLVTESGEINTIAHLWAYEDAADRMRKRAAMMADPEWQNFMKLQADAGYLENMRTNLMVPAKFAPIKR